MTFKPNPNFTRDLAREPWAQDLLRENAEAVEAEAKRNSPLGDDFVGYYGRFKTRIGRASATVGNTDIFAHGIEFGSVNNPVYGPLRRGVSAAGLRFVDRDAPSEI